MLLDSHCSLDQTNKDIQQISIFEHLPALLFIIYGVMQCVVVVPGVAFNYDSVRAKGDI